MSEKSRKDNNPAQTKQSEVKFHNKKISLIPECKRKANSQQKSGIKRNDITEESNTSIYRIVLNRGKGGQPDGPFGFSKLVKAVNNIWVDVRPGRAGSNSSFEHILDAQNE